MPRIRTISGRLTQFEHPNWKPVVDLIGLELVHWFMWMTELELADGAAVHAYKHRATRRYLHVSETGRAFAYIPRDRYLEIDIDEALEEAFFEWEHLFPEPDAAALAAFDEVLRRTRRPVGSDRW